MESKPKILDLIESCEFLIYEYVFIQEDKIIAKYPEILVKYNGDCILKFSMETNFIYINNVYTPIMSIIFETKIGNIIKNNLAYRKTNFVCNDQKRFKIEAQKKGFQLINKNFAAAFKHIISLGLNYYFNHAPEYLPELSYYKRFTGSTVERFLKKTKELKSEVLFVEDFIKKYNIQKINTVILSKTINLYSYNSN